MKVISKNFIKKTKKDLKGGTSSFRSLPLALTSRSRRLASKTRRLPQTTRILPPTKKSRRLPSTGRILKSVSSRRKKIPNTNNIFSAYNPPKYLFYKPKETETKKKPYSLRFENMEYLPIHHSHISCRSSLKELADFLTKKIQSKKYDEALQQIKRCINDRIVDQYNVYSRNYLIKDETKKTSHDIVIEQLQELLDNLYLNKNMLDYILKKQAESDKSAIVEYTPEPYYQLKIKYDNNLGFSLT